MKLQRTESGLWWAEQRVTDETRLTIAPGEAFQKYLSLPHSVLSLAPFPSGDVAMDTASGAVGLERKRGDDLVRSWASGHLAEQLAIMLDSYDHVVLLREAEAVFLAGALVHYDNPMDTWRELEDDLLTFQELGVRLYDSDDEEDTAKVVEHLFHRYDSEIHHALDRHHKIGGNIQRRQLLAVPDWGSKTVSLALDKFGTPINVVNAEPRKLERARISPRKVRALFEAFGRTYAKVHRKVASGQDNSQGA